MRTRFFMLHLRRLAIPGLSVMGLVVVCVYVTELLWPAATRSDLTDALNILLFIGLVSESFIIGAVAFSRVFKERQILFVQTLPMSRAWSFALMTSAAAAAALLSLILVVVTRPGLVAMTLGDRREDSPTLIVALILPFALATGILAGAVFSRAIGVFVGGIVLGAAGLGLAGVVAAFQITGPSGHADRIYNFMAFAMAIAVAAFLAAAAAVYVRGEMTVIRTAPWRALAAVGAIAVVVLSTAGIVYATGALAAGRLPYAWVDASLAPDERRVALVAGSDAFRVRRRIVVYDAANGKKVSEVAEPADYVQWIADDRLVAVSSGRTALHALARRPGGAEVAWLDRDAKETERLKFPFADWCSIVPAGVNTLLVCRSEAVTRLQLVDPNLQTLAEVDVPEVTARQLYPVGDRLWVRTDGRRGVRAFRIGEGIEEISIVDPKASVPLLVVFEGKGHASLESAGRALAEVAPLEKLGGSAEAERRYLCEGGAICVADALVASVQERGADSGTIHRWDRAAGAWKEIARNAQLDWYPEQTSQPLLRTYPASVNLLRDGTLVWVAMHADRTVAMIGEQELVTYPAKTLVEVTRRRGLSEWWQWESRIAFDDSRFRLIGDSDKPYEQQKFAMVNWDARSRRATVTEMRRQQGELYTLRLARDGSRTGLQYRGTHPESTLAVMGTLFSKPGQLLLLKRDAEGKEVKRVVLE